MNLYVIVFFISFDFEQKIMEILLDTGVVGEAKKTHGRKNVGD